MEENTQVIKSLVVMTEPNENILIYLGKFILTADDDSIEVNGELKFEWFPSKAVRFSGNVTYNLFQAIKTFNKHEYFNLTIDNLEVGKCFINHLETGEETYIEGTITNHAIIGDKTVSPEKITFSIPNLRDISIIKIKADNKYIERLTLENDEYTIEIDKRNNFKKLLGSLKENGGYILLYNGEIKKRKGSLSYTDLEPLSFCLSTFISFLNGAKTSPMFGYGIFDEEPIWKAYSSNHVDQYKALQSWVPRYEKIDLNLLWINFSKLWKDDDHKNFLSSAIHWYTEANKQVAFTDGSIILAQTGLELIYNWLVVEQKKFIIGNDAENISASNKIRLVLSLLNLSNDIPLSLKNLSDLKIDEGKIIDAPEKFVQIRNAIVHSQASKRRKLTAISDIQKYEALQLSLWYIELSILYILGYKGKFFSRCSPEKYESASVDFVPWAIHK